MNISVSISVKATNENINKAVRLVERAAKLGREVIIYHKCAVYFPSGSMPQITHSFTGDSFARTLSPVLRLKNARFNAPRIRRDGTLEITTYRRSSIIES